MREAEYRRMMGSFKVAVANLRIKFKHFLHFKLEPQATKRVLQAMWHLPRRNLQMNTSCSMARFVSDFALAQCRRRATLHVEAEAAQSSMRKNGHPVGK